MANIFTPSGEAKRGKNKGPLGIPGPSIPNVFPTGYGGRRGSPGQSSSANRIPNGNKAVADQYIKMLLDKAKTLGGNYSEKPHPQGLTDTEKAAIAQLTKTNQGNSGGGSSNSSGGSSSVTPVDTSSSYDWTWGIPDFKPTDYENPYDKPFDKLIAGAKVTGASDLASIQAIRDSIGGNYDQASKGIYDQYQGSREALDSEAASLGANGGAYYDDSNLRKIQENNDQNKAMDQSYFDKLKNLRGSELDNLYVGLSNEKVQQMAQWSIAQAQRDAAAQQAVVDQRKVVADQMAAAEQAALKSSSGGGGGSRSGGSSSSSGLQKLTTTESATETDTLNDPNFQAILNTVKDPEQRALLIHNQIATGSNANAKLTQQQIDDLNAKANADYVQDLNYHGFLDFRGIQKDRKAKEKAKHDAQVAQQVLLASLGLGGTVGIPSKKKSTTSKGSTTKKGYIP